MREILFRAKRIDNGEWVDGNLFVDEKNEKCEILVGYVNYRISWLVDPATVGQFTGISDANDTKIFEGDIVEIAKEDEPFKVEWCEDLARFVLSASTFCCDFDNYWGYDMEVIGNIHDNPELLGGAEDD